MQYEDEIEAAKTEEDTDQERALWKIGGQNVDICDKAIEKLFEAIRFNEDLNSAFYWRAEAYRIRVSALHK